ncbi:hypothetical protein CapIbe_013675, partial [Capra ibex]
FFLGCKLLTVLLTVADGEWKISTDS